MACYHPMVMYRILTGPNRGEMTFRRPHPPDQDIDGVNRYEVPCGRCIGCRLAKAREWAIRVAAECCYHDERCFLTLTYDPQHLPPDGSLVKSHLQGFFKRLRYYLTPKRIRYFACGEYGSDLGRPHYHVALFGHTFSDLTRVGKTALGDTLWHSQALDSIWTYGKCIIGELNAKSAAYIARYTAKKLYGDDAAAYGAKTPPYIVMSRRPGIGAQFVQEHYKSLYNRDFYVLDGVKLPIPRFFDNYAGLIDPQCVIMSKSRRQQAAIARDKPTLDRLETMELVKTLKTKSLLRM